MVVVLAACNDRPYVEPDPAPIGGSPEARFRCVRSISPTSGRIGADITLTGDLGEPAVPIVFTDESGQSVPLTVRSWSATEAVVSVPAVDAGGWTVTIPHGCVLPAPPAFQVLLPPRVYINNNTNNADGFDTITTMTYDPISGALSPMGPPTSTGLPASHRPGCSDSLTIAGSPPKLYASGDTGVAVLDIDLKTGALQPSSSGSPFITGSTGGAALSRTVGAYVWNATDDGIVVWRDGGVDRLVSRTVVSTSPARAMVTFGLRPSQVYATRGDGTFDAWSVAYAPDTANSPGLLPVLTPLAGSPFGTAQASPSSGGLVYLAARDHNDLLYVPTAAGLAVWHVGNPPTATEADGSPFALNPPGGELSRPQLLTSPLPRTIYMAGIGTGYLVGATLDAAGAPTAIPGSPWSFAPDLTNLSCIITTPAPSGVRLIVSDAGNRKIGVFDVHGTAAMPAAVPGSPFTMTETPSELASGIAILGAFAASPQ